MNTKHLDIRLETDPNYGTCGYTIGYYRDTITVGHSGGTDGSDAIVEAMVEIPGTFRTVEGFERARKMLGIDLDFTTI